MILVKLQSRNHLEVLRSKLPYQNLIQIEILSVATTEVMQSGKEKVFYWNYWNDKKLIAQSLLQ